jgi:hypothetical protein
MVLSFSIKRDQSTFLDFAFWMFSWKSHLLAIKNLILLGNLSLWRPSMAKDKLYVCVASYN